MGFGTSSFGSVPFGTTIISLVASPEVTYVEFMGKDLIRVWFTEDMIVDDSYFNSSNYSIVDSFNANLPVVRIVRANAVSLPYVLLRTKPQIENQEYTITVSNITDRTGSVISAPYNTGLWVYNRTKGDSIVAAMPEMYDLAADANLRGLLQAVANEDNIIGGLPSGDEDE